MSEVDEGRGHTVHAFEGEVEVDSADQASVDTGLARAIADAAYRAYHDAPGLRDSYFEVSRIQVRVGNPGPTAYKVIITPGG
ncbi:MAG: hypothetical protein ACRDPX_13340 [Gaiellaceae bacterium]